MRLTPFKILFIIVILVLLYSDFPRMIRTIKKKINDYRKRGI